MNMIDMIDMPAPAPPAERSRARPLTRLGEIEVLRTVAVALVLIEHLSPNLIFWKTRLADRVLNDGGFWTGVDLFFAISGFVIARALLPRLLPLTDATSFMRMALDFWLRRGWRLLPSSWFWLAAPLVLCLVFNKSGAYGSFQANFEQSVAGVLNLANFHLAEVFGRYDSGTAFVQWSLSLEEQFYLLLPFAVFVFRRYLPVPLLLIFCYGFIASGTALGNMTRGGAVSLGVLLAIWSRHQSYRDFEPVVLARLRPARMALLVVGVVCMVSLGSKQLHIVPVFLPPVAVVAVFLVWLASYDQGYLWRPGVSRQLMEILAARSYSLYLVHIPVYFAMHEIWFRLHRASVPSRIQNLVYLASTIVLLALVSELNHRLLERPLRARGKRIADRFSAGLRERAI